MKCEFSSMKFYIMHDQRTGFKKSSINFYRFEYSNRIIYLCIPVIHVPWKRILRRCKVNISKSFTKSKSLRLCQNVLKLCSLLSSKFCERLSFPGPWLLKMPNSWYIFWFLQTTFMLFCNVVFRQFDMLSIPSVKNIVSVR